MIYFVFLSKSDPPFSNFLQNAITSARMNGCEVRWIVMQGNQKKMELFRAFLDQFPCNSEDQFILALNPNLIILKGSNISLDKLYVSFKNEFTEDIIMGTKQLCMDFLSQPLKKNQVETEGIYELTAQPIQENGMIYYLPKLFHYSSQLWVSNRKKNYIQLLEQLGDQYYHSLPKKWKRKLLLPPDWDNEWIQSRKIVFQNKKMILPTIQTNGSKIEYKPIETEWNPIVVFIVFLIMFAILMGGFWIYHLKRYKPDDSSAPPSFASSKSME